MRLIARLVVLVLLSAGLAVVVGPQIAQANVICQPIDGGTICCDQGTGVCTTKRQPPKPPSRPPGTPTPPTKGGGCQQGGNPIPCSGPLGTWSNKYQCYLDKMDPQPADAAQHKGQTAYSCTSYNGRFGAIVRTVVWETGPVAPPPADPADVAAAIVKQMRLRPPEFADVFAPRPLEFDRTSMGAVGLPVWMAIDRSPQTSGPVTITSTLGGTTVTATAAPDYYLWSLGPRQVWCAGPGTVFRVSFGITTSPDCGYRYTRISPAGGFPVSVRVHWSVRWAGAGQAGVIPLDLTSATRHVLVGEYQALGVS